MRRPLIDGTGALGFGFLKAFVEAGKLPRQGINFLPLRRDGLVQRLDGVVLERQTGFQRVEAFAENFYGVVLLNVTHLNQALFDARASRG